MKEIPMSIEAMQAVRSWWRSVGRLGWTSVAIMLLHPLPAAASHIATPTSLRDECVNSPDNVVQLDHAVKVSLPGPGASSPLPVPSGCTLVLGPNAKLETEFVQFSFTDPLVIHVSPGIFVPMAEDSGLIATLGHFVLRQACATVGACRRAGLGSPRVAVNLSARQLHNPDLIEEVNAISAEYGFAPGDLELELTESSVMEDFAVAAEHIGRLTDLGVRLALDDFGTGYSTLAYLKHFRIHALKIDQSFVSGLPGDAEDAAIVRAILAMGRALGLDIMAEGVETDAQCRFLVAEGCQYIQGYLFARPLALGALLAWLRKRQDAARDGVRSA